MSKILWIWIGGLLLGLLGGLKYRKIYKTSVIWGLFGGAIAALVITLKVLR